jgi:cysteine desulfurase / selenocysteine lyase
MATALSFDVEAIRADFPILGTTVHGRPLVYLDNAATTQKPRQVLDALTDYYTSSNANVHRGVHHLSGKATDLFEEARAAIARFIGAAEPREVIFTRNATEGVNLVAQTWGRTHVHAGDEILVSALEHHSNIVPWYMLCAEKGATLRVIPMFDNGELDLEALPRLLSPRTRLVAISALSNALGTVTPVAEIIRQAHAAGALVLVDGAQAAYHMPIDVRALDCDFFVMTGHKLYGPTGIGVLYGKAALLEAMPPWMGGGDMIASVTFERCTWNVLPNKFEAGTPDISGAVGLGAAVAYLSAIGMDRVQAYEQELLAYGTAALGDVEGLRLIGTAPRKASILSFVMEGVHPHDLGTIVDREGVAIRTGQHCAQPVMDRLGIPATARASLAMYNTREEIDALVAALHKARKVFA